jgi:4-alpha-glucanotransferase
VPELADAPNARALLASPELAAERARLRAAPLVEHAAVMALKRALLEELHRGLRGARREALARFLERRPELADHARFQAVLERERRPWHAWPQRLRDGRIEPGDHDPTVAELHGYAQMLAAEQLAALTAQPGRAEIYLDLPIGVHPDGYDTWSERTAFLAGVSVGAPPDLFFASGQDWGLPAPDMRRDRARSLRYFGACLRHHLSAARWLRVDHVMGLHRLWVIPPGAGARDGVYLRQPADELYALLCLEARRAGATIVGEDLGTVPAGVRARLARHGILGMYVLPFEVDPERAPAVAEPRADALAGLGTHDTPTFRGYWSGADLAERGEAPGSAALAERAAQTTALVEALVRAGRLPAAHAHSPEELLRAALLALAASPARALLVGVEDLLLEHEPQNRPGTVEGGNWRRRCRLALEELSGQEPLVELLRALAREREVAGTRHGS